MPKDDLDKKFGKAFKPAFGNGMKNKWYKLNKADGTVERVAESAIDTDAQILREVQEGKKVDEKVVKFLIKRKMLTKKKFTSFYATKGEDFATEIIDKKADLTREMLQDGSWKTTKFADFNLNSLGKEFTVGGQHPLLRVRTQFRSILLEMGFSEMPTNNYVESSFWNFDSLFQPQQHPARDAHDTFFIKEPEFSKIDNEEYWAKVKKMHEEGDEESIGWRYNWSYDEAKRNIFRTHTTAVSARMLYKLAQDGFKPQKLFSVDRVFRNETLDATHLAEFHQVEGVVCGFDLGL